jgi:transmembrane sensor
MTSPKIRVERAETEAAAWHAKLGVKPVSSDTIKEFFAWREDPAHAEAYRRVHKAWTDTGRLVADPELQRVLDEAMTRRSKAIAARPRRTFIGFAAAGAGLALVLAVGTWSWLEARAQFSTAVGEQRLVQLADGSSVRLDTDTRIRVRFDNARRVIDLEQGQALFSVAHDSGRPFLVRAGDTRVTAVGTVFDVRRDSADVRVTLVQGVVEVAGAEEGRAPSRMTAGQQTRVTAAGTATKAVDVETATSWADGRIVFKDTPLRAAVAEVNRYLTQKIELDADAKADVAVSGVFKVGDRDAFVSTAAAVLGLRVSAGEGGTVRLSAPGEN